MESSETTNGALSDTFLGNSQQCFVHDASLSGTEEDALGTLAGGDGSDAGEHSRGAGDSEPLREQDRFLPIANVARIMKNTIPPTGKIAKDAKECVQECVSEFVSFITSEASERCHQEKRKTINGEDILYAMHTLGFDNYLEPLKAYLQKYREITVKSLSDLKGLGPDGSEQQTTMEEITADDSFTNILSAQETDGSSHVVYTSAFGNQLNF